MKVPKNQNQKYSLVGKEIDFIDETKVLSCGKIAGFTMDRVIVTTWDDLEGCEIEPEKIYLPDEQ